MNPTKQIIKMFEFMNRSSHDILKNNYPLFQWGYGSYYGRKIIFSSGKSLFRPPEHFIQMSLFQLCLLLKGLELDHQLPILKTKKIAVHEAIDIGKEQ